MCEYAPWPRYGDDEHAAVRNSYHGQGAAVLVMIRFDCREITSVWFTAASERDSVFGMLSCSVCSEYTTNTPTFINFKINCCLQSLKGARSGHGEESTHDEPFPNPTKNTPPFISFVTGTWQARRELAIRLYSNTNRGVLPMGTFSMNSSSWAVGFSSTFESSREGTTWQKAQEGPKQINQTRQTRTLSERFLRPILCSLYSSGQTSSVAVTYTKSVTGDK